MADTPPYVFNDPLSDPKAAQRSALVTALVASDAARAATPFVTLVAVTSFTMVQDGVAGAPPQQQVINAGDQFQIRSYDLPRYLGRGRLL